MAGIDTGLSQILCQPPAQRHINVTVIPCQATVTVLKGKREGEEKECDRRGGNPRGTVELGPILLVCW
jgi:hypothetical protein